MAAEVSIFFHGDPRGAVSATKAVESQLGSLKSAAGDVESSLVRVGQGISSMGAFLTKTLTPVAAAVGLAGKAAFEDWDAGIDTIRVKTGATGKDLQALEQVMTTVAGRSTQSLAQVGDTVGELNARLELTGKPLETIARRFLDLDRIGMAASVENVSRAFGDWSVKTEDQEKVLDQFFRGAQASGVEIDRLASAVVKFGAPLRQMGFSLEESIGIVAKFEEEGVNTELVLGSMRIALGKLAKAGKDPVATFREIVDQISKTGSTATANRLAIELFGARAGPDMAAAIREGRFEIESYIRQIEGGKDTIAAASEDTLDLSDKLSMLRNRVVAAAGPYGEMVAVIGGGLAAIGPTLFALGQIIPLLGSLATSTKLAAAAQWLLNAALSANPIGVVVVALAALVAGIVLAWRESETFRNIVTGAFNAVRAAAEFVLEFFRTHWKTIAVLISGPFAPIVALATNAFGVRSALVGAFNAVLDFVRKHWKTIAVLVSGPFAPLVALATDAFGVRSALVGALEATRDTVGRIIDSLVGLFRRVVSVVDRIRDGISWLRDNAAKIIRTLVDKLEGPLGVLKAALEPVAALLEAIRRAMVAIKTIAGDVAGAIKTVAAAADKVGGFLAGLVPGKRQHGGPVFPGGSYLVGEAGRELFVPTSAGFILPNGATEALLAGRAATEMSGGGGRRGWNLNLTVQGDFIGDRVWVERLAEKLAPEIGRVAMYESRA